MSQTARGLVVFASVLVTIGFWMPLSNSPRLAPTGGTITETYFGVFRYATMHAVMKEPDYALSWSLEPKRLILTAVVTVVFWGTVIWFIRKRRGLAADGTDAE